MTSIEDAVKQAKEAAAKMVPETGGAVIEGSVSPAGVVTTFSKPSMSSIKASTSVIPKQIPYIKVNEFGIRIGKGKEFLSEIEAIIDMTEDKGFQVKHTIRFGNPATYLSTFDGQVCDKGGSWIDAMRRAKMADPSAEPYHSVDVVVEVTKAIKTKDDEVKVGQLLGFNSSKTNFSEWTDFYTACAQAGLLGQRVKVKLGCREIQHNGNTWGVVTFALAE